MTCKNDSECAYGEKCSSGVCTKTAETEDQDASTEPAEDNPPA